MAENEVKTDNRVKYLVESQEFGTLQFSYPAGTSDEEIAKKQYVTVDEARKHIIRPEMPDDEKKSVTAEKLERYPLGQPENIQGPAVIRYVRRTPSYYESKKLGEHQKVYGRSLPEYDMLVKNALRRLTEREPFSYDPGKDEEYIKYTEQMRDAAESAYRRILNDNNTSVFGASGAVLSEAAAAKNAALLKIPDITEKLYERAYKQYTGETKRLRDELSDITGLAEAAYKRDRESDKDEYSRARLAQQDLFKEDQRQFENDAFLRREEREAERFERRDAREAAMHLLELEGQEIRNRSAATEANIKEINEAEERIKAGMDAIYASSYEEYLALRLAGMRLDNQLKEKAYNSKEVSDYDSGYYRKRGQIDAILGIYRG